MAQQVLKHLVHAQDRKVTIDSIQKAVAEKLRHQAIQLKEKSNTKNIVVPRQVAMYLVKELTHGLAAGDRPRFRRQAPHHRDAFRQENRASCATPIRN